jgi:hypothetical protein
VTHSTGLVRCKRRGNRPLVLDSRGAKETAICGGGGGGQGSNPSLAGLPSCRRNCYFNSLLGTFLALVIFDSFLTESFLLKKNNFLNPGEIISFQKVSSPDAVLFCLCRYLPPPPLSISPSVSPLFL